MNSFLIIGMVVVNGALISYSMALWTEHRKKIFTRFILIALTIGITLDMTATVCMIAGSRNGPFTLHGLLGYSALTAMLIDTILTWRHWKSDRNNQPISRGLLLYSRFAYLWWVLAYVVGALMVIFGKG